MNIAEKDIKNIIDTLVSSHYEHIEAPLNVDGEQFYNGSWWAPIDGCDTLQSMMEDLECILKRK